jgi:hypothetical protein
MKHTDPTQPMSIFRDVTEHAVIVTVMQKQQLMTSRKVIPPAAAYVISNPIRFFYCTGRFEREHRYIFLNLF